VIGPIRRECLDHVIVLSERSPRYYLSRFVGYSTRAERISDCTRTRRSHGQRKPWSPSCRRVFGYWRRAPSLWAPRAWRSLRPRPGAPGVFSSSKRTTAQAQRRLSRRRGRARPDEGPELP